MAKGKYNLEDILKEVYTNDIQIKRVTKEIGKIKEINEEDFQITLDSTALGLKIVFKIFPSKLSPELQIYLNELSINAIVAEILLEQKFPFVPPRVLIQSSILFPSLADGRDFLDNVSEEKWGPSHELWNVAKKLPGFFSNIFKERSSTIKLLSAGKYHLGQLYNLGDFEILKKVSIYPVKEYLNPHDSIYRYIILTEGFILNLDILDKAKKVLRLVGAYPFRHLNTIKRKSEKSTTICLGIFDQVTREQFQQILLLEDSKTFVDDMIERMKKYNVKIKKNNLVHSIIPSPQKSAEAIKRTDPKYKKVLLQEIALAEGKLEKEFSIDTVQNLMHCYQQIIEFFSAKNDSNFEIYLVKLQSFLHRSDVDAILRSKESAEISKKMDATKNNNVNGGMGSPSEDKEFFIGDEDEANEEEEKNKTKKSTALNQNVLKVTENTSKLIMNNNTESMSIETTNSFNGALNNNQELLNEEKKVMEERGEEFLSTFSKDDEHIKAIYEPSKPNIDKEKLEDENTKKKLIEKEHHDDVIHNKNVNELDLSASLNEVINPELQSD